MRPPVLRWPRRLAAAASTALLASAACADAGGPTAAAPLDAPLTRSPAPIVSDRELDARLEGTLASHGFTGRSASRVEAHLGRPLDRSLVEAGRLLFFDPVTSLSGDNTCSGCHAPNAAFGGTQSIAIGVDNNGVVGPDRAGPRNLRRSPTVANTALFPRIMLDSRFEALSGDPFDNSGGFQFPAPEGTSLSHLPHLLSAQAFMPVVDRSEMAGFEVEATRGEMRAEIARRVDALPDYRELFGRAFPDIAAGAPVSFDHIGRAMAEFQASLVFADAPVDAYARGKRHALTADEKRGALLFFGKAGCVGCHAVDVPFASGDEMFTDYRHHVVGVPQVVPDVSNVDFDGAGNEDRGRENVTEDAADRYAFRTSPLRNVALQPFFMHDGAFSRLEDAVHHHLDAYGSARGYSPSGLDADLGTLGPLEPILERLDPRIADPPALTDEEFDRLLAFVRCGLLDAAARPERLHRLVPRRLPSGRAVHDFQLTSSAGLAARCASSRAWDEGS